jgi:tRNA-splicing ligase RtcB
MDATEDTEDTDVLILNEYVAIMTKSADQSAIDQVKEFIKHPAFVNKKARFMPDIHAGAGCVIGTTVELGEFVVPNIIGVDIGCGVLAVELGALDIDYKKLHQFIINHIPSGCVNHKTNNIALLQHVYQAMRDEFNGNAFPKTFDSFVDQLNDAAEMVSAGVTTNALGTLGGGEPYDCLRA